MLQKKIFLRDNNDGIVIESNNLEEERAFFRKPQARRLEDVGNIRFFDEGGWGILSSDYVDLIQH